MADLETLRPEVKTMLNDLSAEDVRALFIYDETTGILRWRQSRRHGIEAGAEAGCFDRKGYRSVTVNSRHYRVHRIIWLYMTGKWPIHQVDHINGAHADNRWVNLRDATNAENQQNAKLRSTNTSGLRGVSWYARDIANGDVSLSAPTGVPHAPWTDAEKSELRKAMEKLAERERCANTED